MALFIMATHSNSPLSKNLAISSLALLMGTALQAHAQAPIHTFDDQNAKTEWTPIVSLPIWCSGSGTGYDSKGSLVNGSNFIIEAIDSIPNAIATTDGAYFESIQLGNNDKTFTVKAEKGYGFYLDATLSKPSESVTTSTPDIKVSLKNLTVTSEKSGFYSSFHIKDTFTVSGSQFTTQTGSGIELVQGADGLQISDTTITSVASHGLALAGTFGKVADDTNSLPATETPATLNIGSGTTITATQGSALYLGSNSTPTTILGDIRIASGASLTGQYGIYVDRQATVTGNIEVLGSVNRIYNAGTVTGDVTNTLATSSDLPEETPADVSADTSTPGTLNEIINVGVIEGNISLYAAPSTQGTQREATTPKILNEQTIHGHITINGGNAQIVNHGLVAKGITYAGTGTLDITVGASGQVGANDQGAQLTLSQAGSKVKISDWPVALHQNDSGQTVVTPISTSGSGSITGIDHLTITSLGDGELTQPIDFQSVVSGSDFTGNVKAVSFSEDLQNSGALEGHYDATSGQFTTRFNAERASAGILARNYATQLMRRDLFVQGVLASENMGMLNRPELFSYQQVYVKPYASTGQYDYASLATKADTQGIMVGANWAQGPAALSVAIGYESTEASNDRFDNTLDSAYLALQGMATLATIGQAELFGQVNVNFSRTSIDIANYQSASVATATTSASHFGVGTHLGLHYRLNRQSIITPSVGLGFTNAQISDYTMSDSALGDNYNPASLTIGFADLNLAWKQGWAPRLETSLSAGMRFNFKDAFALQATYQQSALTGTYHLASTYEYLNATVTGHLPFNQDLSMSYQGVYDTYGATHGVLVKWGLHF